MNKPSIYAGFGDKKALYMKAIGLYRSLSRRNIEGALEAAPTLAEGLRQVARNAIASYVRGDFGPRGCFLVGTAVTEAASEPEVKRALDESVKEMEAVFAERFAKAQAAGVATLPGSPQILAHMASDVIYGVALRARAGQSREDLVAASDAAMSLICGETEAGTRT